VFAVFDNNHDGTIDFQEFLLAVAAGTPGDIDSHLDYVFEM
jgi:Ca2+-binding EF-hand superfamily protein